MITEKYQKTSGGGYNAALSLLRIIATLSVIFLHTNGTLERNAEIFSLGERAVLLYQRCVSMMCWAVPCFFMITGALLLNKEKQITVQSCFCKYIRRILLALFLFGVPFALMKTLFETKTLSLHSLSDALLAVLQNKSWDHLWYLYALIGAYLLLPILKRFTDNCTKNELLYACLLLLFFGCIVPVINAAGGIEIAITVWLPLRPCFYMLAGHYLSKYTPKIKLRQLSACALFLLAVLWVLDGCGTTELLTSVKTCLVVSVSTAVFVTFLTLQIDIPERTKTALWRIDRLCFGVYLIHPVFIHLMYRFFNISPISFGDSILAVLVFFVGFSTVSFAASRVMSLIKPLREYVL